jgi:hypothetical protein
MRDLILATTIGGTVLVALAVDAAVLGLAITRKFKKV